MTLRGAAFIVDAWLMIYQTHVSRTQHSIGVRTAPDVRLGRLRLARDTGAFKKYAVCRFGRRHSLLPVAIYSFVV